MNQLSERCIINVSFKIVHQVDLSLMVHSFLLILSLQTPCFSENDSSATTAADPIVQSMNKIVVSSFRCRYQPDQSYSQRTIDKQEIEQNIASSLADVLDMDPGIYKKSEYISPVTLRGLGGKRLLFTKDGNRRMSNFSDGYMGQMINTYELSKVEILRGPASVIYGPGAITGIINLISKEPDMQERTSVRLLSSYSLNGNEFNTQASTNITRKQQSIYLSGKFRNADDYMFPGRKTAYNSSYQDKDIRTMYMLKVDSTSLIKAECEYHLGGPWERALGFNGTEYMLVVNLSDNILHSAVTFSGIPSTSRFTLESSLFFDNEYRVQNKDSYDAGSGLLSYRESVTHKDNYFGWRALSSIFINSHITLKSGTDGIRYRIFSPTTLTDFFLGNEIRNKNANNAGVLMGGIFSELNVDHPETKNNFRAGIRADRVYITEGNVHDTLQVRGQTKHIDTWEGIASSVYKLFENAYVSLQVARSSRFPDASEMFLISSNADGIVYGNPDLRPEHGINFDMGIRGALESITFDVSAFANFFYDFISIEYWKNSGKKGINYTWLNINRARVMGIEISAETQLKLKITHPAAINLQSGFVLIRGDAFSIKNRWTGEGIPLRAIEPPTMKSAAVFTTSIKRKFDIYAGGDLRFKFPQNRIPPADSGYNHQGYAVAGLMCGLSIMRADHTIDIKIKIDNIIDKRYIPHETILPGKGRNFKLLVAVN